MLEANTGNFSATRNVYDWYQTNTHVIINIMIKNLKEADVKVKLIDETLDVTCDLADGSIFKLHFNLFKAIYVQDSSWSVTPSKLEIKLKKTDRKRWQSLEQIPEKTKRINSHSNHTHLLNNQHDPRQQSSPSQNRVQSHSLTQPPSQSSKLNQQQQHHLSQQSQPQKPKATSTLTPSSQLESQQTNQRLDQESVQEEPQLDTEVTKQFRSDQLLTQIEPSSPREEPLDQLESDSLINETHQEPNEDQNEEELQTDELQDESIVIDQEKQSDEIQMNEDHHHHLILEHYKEEEEQLKTEEEEIGETESVKYSRVDDEQEQSSNQLPEEQIQLQIDDQPDEDHELHELQNSSPNSSEPNGDPSQHQPELQSLQGDQQVTINQDQQEEDQHQLPNDDQQQLQLQSQQTVLYILTEQSFFGPTIDI